VQKKDVTHTIFLHHSSSAQVLLLEYGRYMQSAINLLHLEK